MVKYFAELDQNNRVLRVIVVSEEDCCDSNGNHNEECGITFCKLLTNNPLSKWKESFKDRSQRKNAAGYGFTYDSVRDAFIPPQPFASWILNEEICQWEPPYPRPELTEEDLNNRKFYIWDEDLYLSDPTKGWVLTSLENSI